jgi:hypothetical protein
MAIIVGPNYAKPTHHIKLAKGGQELGLLLCDARGKFRDIVDRNPFPPSAIKTYSGPQKHGDSEPPFINLVQDDWSLGRGQETFEDNKSRYADGQVADTLMKNKVILGSQPTYSTGIRDWGGYMPGSVEWQGLYGSQRYLERGWTNGSTAWEANRAHILLRKKGSPNSGVTIELRSSDLGTTHKTIVISSGNITNDFLAVWVRGDWTGKEWILTSTKYRLVVYGTSGSDDADNCWEIAVEPYDATSLDSSKSDNGSSWTDTSTQFGIYYRLVDVRKSFTAHFIEYKEQLYLGTQLDDHAVAGELYRNGDRGVCDSNSTDKSKLNDSGKTGWTTQPGLTAKVITAAPTKERQNWRDIVGSGSGYVTCNPDWEITHNTNTEYVILGSDEWTAINDSSLIIRGISDIVVANDIMYLAQDRQADLLMHRELSQDGTFYDVNPTVNCWKPGGPRCDYMQVILDYISGPVIWFGRNDVLSGGDAFIIRDLAPISWAEEPVGWTHLWNMRGTWDEQVIGNVTANMAGKSAQLDVAEAFTTGVIGSKAISSKDVRYSAQLRIVLSSSIDLAAGVLEFVMDNSANCASPNVSIAFPAIKKNTPKQYKLDFDASGVSGADAIISIGLRLTQDVVAVKIKTKGFIAGLKAGGNPIVLGDKRLNGLERYGEPEALWVLTEGELGEIRNNFYQPSPLRELNSVKDSSNGKAHLVHDLYLYFSLKEGLERYYRQHLDDIGPNRDQGLPSDRHGVISHLVGFPGRIFAAVDAGSGGYSSVLCYDNSGWHEIYRARFAGNRIRRLHIQSMPGKLHSRLWISEGPEVLWIPIAINPLQDTEYRYTYEGAVTSSRIYGGMQDISKWFKSVKLASRNLSSGIQIYVDYRTDESIAWTRISNPFTSSPYQEEDFISTMDVEGRYVELRLVLQTDDNTITPQLLAFLIKSIQLGDAKYKVTYNFRVKDNDKDLQGDPIDMDVSTFVSQLESWVGTPTPMYVNSNSDLEDSKWMVAQPASLRRLDVIEEDDGKELHICQLTLLES